MNGSPAWATTPTELDLGRGWAMTWNALRSNEDLGLPAYADGRLPQVNRASFVGSRANRQDLVLRDLFAELTHELGQGGMLNLDPAVDRLFPSASPHQYRTFWLR